MRKVCNVAVANIWSSPDKIKSLDTECLTSPVNIQKWLLGLNIEEKQSYCEDLAIDTQVLYGEEVEVLEELGDWSKVVCIHQASDKHALGYPGYIKSCQLSDTYEQTDSFARVIVPKALSYHDHSPHIVLSFNVTLPVIRKDKEFTILRSPHGEIKVRTPYLEVSKDYFPGISHDFERLYNAASEFIDLGYLWGGMSSYGYDCSGFVYQIYRHLGHKLPRDAHDQYSTTTPVEKKDLQKGDLVYFSTEKSIDAISHIGIYIGGGMMIHAPYTPKAIEEITIASGYYMEHYVGASRVLDCA